MEFVLAGSAFGSGFIHLLSQIFPLFTSFKTLWLSGSGIFVYFFTISILFLFFIFLFNYIKNTETSEPILNENRFYKLWWLAQAFGIAETNTETVSQ